MDPDEKMLTDISLMIFDAEGDAEYCVTLGKGELEYSADLVAGKEYTLCACANFGRPVYADHIDELEEITYYMAYPDEYREGIPMSARKTVVISGDEEVEMELERLMARISLRMDRRRLSDDVEMNVRSVRVGNCPRVVAPFRDSRAEGPDDCFPVGFYRNDLETAVLNYVADDGLSGSVSLYLLENMQGDLGKLISEDKEKVFAEDDPRRDRCSYVELEMEYLSDRKQSGEKNLIYRFYLGEDRNSLDVERNCLYDIVVCPENDGLSEDSWRVDKSGLCDIQPVSFASYPSSYIRGDIGDEVHIWCEFTPSSAPFDVGVEYLEYDKAEGIYDYVIDEDGHGAVLTLTAPGRGLVYMEAGEPVNEAALFVIEVNLP